MRIELYTWWTLGVVIIEDNLNHQSLVTSKGYCWTWSGIIVDIRWWTGFYVHRVYFHNSLLPSPASSPFHKRIHTSVKMQNTLQKWQSIYMFFYIAKLQNAENRGPYKCKNAEYAAEVRNMWYTSKLQNVENRLRFAWICNTFGYIFGWAPNQQTPYTYCKTFPTTHRSMYSFDRSTNIEQQLFHSPQKNWNIKTSKPLGRCNVEISQNHLPAQTHPNSQSVYLPCRSVQASWIWDKYLSTERMLIRRGETCLVI